VIRKIGKYELRERIGRGGMGTVFKAYDPELDRSVAIKIISDDIDITEEMRARFIREAQACAKLSHPNIVTIYDLGALDGRLYIVMELLEGEELRRLIADRRRLALEDKLALMIQVCDGLYYAHQRGVIHRDIKPGNVIVLPDGAAKIVDFGLALVATLGAGLTKSGLVMGTFRYISPEQARGRPDHRSDMYSLGSVFYEFLSYRPALTGQDPMHLLEQLRTEDPPTLSELDVGVPADLSAVIARAMRKDPAERFANLGEMRAELENIQLRLAGEAVEARRRIAQQLERARRLQTALAERMGPRASPASLPEVPDRARLDTLLTVESALTEQAQNLERLLQRAEATSPTLQRGLSNLDGGRFAEAIVDLEAVLAELPEHEPAAAALDEARRRAAEEHRRRLVRERLEAASVALEAGAYRSCIAILDELSDEAERVGLSGDAEGLRRAAEAAAAAEETARQGELRRQREMAEAALALMQHARDLARDVDAPRHAETLWREAEDKADSGGAAFDQSAFVRAAEMFEAATALYRRAEEAGWDVIRQEELRRQRTQADQAMQRMARQRTAAEAVEAPRRAETLWAQANGRAQDGQVAIAQEAFLRATESFEAAAALFRRAEEAAREAIRKEEIERQRNEAEQARATAHEAREKAQVADARRRALSLWQAAEARETAAQEALTGNAYTQALRLFQEAGSLYSDGARTAIAVRQQEQQRAEESLQQAIHRRGQAEDALSAGLAPAPWSSAEAKLAEGRSALAAANYVSALQRAAEAEALYQQAMQEAETLRGRQRDQAGRDRELAAQRRSAAAAQEANVRAPDIWREAEGAMLEAETAFSEGQYPVSSDRFAKAAELLERAETAARDAMQREERDRQRERSEQARGAMLERRTSAEQADARRLAAATWRAAAERADEGRRAHDEGRYAEASLIFQHAATLFTETEELAAEMSRREALARQREDAERARQSMAMARAAAAAVEAGRRSAPHWTQAEAKAAEARAAATRGEHSAASSAFAEAAALYGAAERHSRELISAEEARHQRQLADRARDLMTRRRTVARDMRAETAAATLWAAATVSEQEAVAAFDAGEYPRAVQAFARATELYRQAEDVARRATVDAEATITTIDRTGLDRTAVAPEHSAAPSSAVRDDDATVLPDASTVGVHEADPATVDVRVTDHTMLPGVAAVDAPIAPEDTAVSPQGGTALPSPPDVEETVLADVTRVADETRLDRTEIAPAERRRPRIRLTRVHAVAAGVIGIALLAAVGASIISFRTPSNTKGLAQTRLEGALAARLDAEKAGAPSHARERMARARGYESQGEEALGRGDHAAAASAFGQAATAYREAKTATDELRGALEKARNEAAAARNDALAAKAGEFAKDAYNQGVAKEQEGESLRSQDFARARQLYADATGLFGTSARQARQLGELRVKADQARDRMRGDKQRATGREVTSEYRAASVKEVEAERAYAGHLFAQANEAFTGAQDLYAKAAAGPPPPPPGRLLAEQQRAAARVAKDEAERTGAASNAQGLMVRARGHESQGDQAFNRQDYAGAATAFGHADMAYREAKAAVDEQRSRMAMARTEAAKAHKEAVDARAGDLAQDVFSQGVARQQDAENQSRQQLALAAQGFTDAAALFRTAVTRAREAEQRLRIPPPPPPGKLLAEQRRTAARTAKVEAERAAAPNNAQALMARARGHESDGEQAFGRQDYAAAATAFGHADMAYREAKTAVDELRGRMTVARDETTRAHKEAVEAKATDLAKDVFGQGLAKEQDAENLSRQQFTLAIQGFTDAAALFRTAAIRAREADQRLRADQTRDDMRQQKQQAGGREDSAEYKAANLKEAEGERAYAGRLFAQSGEAFAAARDLYVKAASVPSRPSQSQAPSPDAVKPPTRSPERRPAPPIF
jgi:hypothetical protein